MCFHEILGVSLDQQILYCLLGSPLCDLSFLCFWVRVLISGMVLPPAAVPAVSRGHVKQYLIEQYRMLLVSVSSAYLISGLSLHFGSRFHGLWLFPSPLQTCKYQSLSRSSRPTLPAQKGLLIKLNVNRVDWSFSHYTPAPSPQTRVPTTQVLRFQFSLSLPLCVFLIRAAKAVDRSDLPAASLPRGIAKQVFGNHSSPLGDFVQQCPITTSSPCRRYPPVVSSPSW